MCITAYLDPCGGRKTNPDLPADASLEVELHEVKLDNGEVLYVVTTLKVSSESAAEFYGRRDDVEHDIRDMKISLGIENIRAKSYEMVQKEHRAAWSLTTWWWSYVARRRKSPKSNHGA